jgi:hypothetical protein
LLKHKNGKILIKIVFKLKSINKPLKLLKHKNEIILIKVFFKNEKLKINKITEA